MNYWQRWIGDWKRKTAHLSACEKGIYGELLDHLYANDTALLPLDHRAVARIAGATEKREIAAVNTVLVQFFKRTDEGYLSTRTEEELKNRLHYIEQQRGLAIRGWQKRRSEKPRHQSNSKEGPNPLGAETWNTYAVAYQLRYHTLPVRNARANALIAQLVQRLGAEASEVATFFLSHNESFYVKKRHPLNLLLTDAESLRTQWKTGVKATALEARSAEARDGAQEQLKRLRGPQNGA